MNVVRSLGVALIAALSLAGCRRGDSGAPDGGAPTAALSSAVSMERCAACHGVAGPKGAPDLRRSPLTAIRSDAELAAALRAQAAHDFAPGLTEPQAAALVATLRDDMLSLKDCFPEATGWVTLTAPENQEPVVAAYAAGARPAGAMKDSELPHGTPLLGLALFARGVVGTDGAVPVAILVDPAGELLGVRVALPRAERPAAQRALEASLRGGDASVGSLKVKLDRVRAVAVELSR